MNRCFLCVCDVLIRHTILWLTSAICDSYLLLHIARVSHGKYARLKVILEEKFPFVYLLYLWSAELSFPVDFQVQMRNTNFQVQIRNTKYYQLSFFFHTSFILHFNFFMELSICDY